MLVDVSHIRPIAHYPYKGHVFATQNIAGIADAQEAFDSALHAIAVGNLAASGSTRMEVDRVGGMYIAGNGNEWLAEQPVIGIADGIGQYPNVWTMPAVFEIVPQLNKFALVVTVRMQGPDFATTNLANLVTGEGGRACFWDVTMAGWNNGVVIGSKLIARYFWDRTYYAATVPAPLAPTAADVDNWAQIPPLDAFKQITILGEIDPSMIVNANTANLGTISFSLQYPLHPLLETPWSPTAIADGVTSPVSPAQDPLTGVNLNCDGVIDFQLYFYR